MEKLELKQLLISIKTQENENIINMLLNKIDTIDDNSLQEAIKKVGGTRKSVELFLQERISQEISERKKVLSAYEKFMSDISSIPAEIKENSIILIGPMGTGKSTIAQLLASQISEMERIGLDNKLQLESFYEQQDKFSNFKNFEFVLTGMVLSSLKKSSIIDFGAGHSIYENHELKDKMKLMCSQFKNIFLLLPTIDKEINRQILCERRQIKLGSHKDQDNWHFLTAPDNYELATHIIYENGKRPEEISKEIIKILKSKEKTLDNQYK